MFYRRYCHENSLDPNLANGTIVLCCGGLGNAQGAEAAGAAGAIFQEDSLKDASEADSILLPASCLVSADGTQVYGYINTATYNFYYCTLPILVFVLGSMVCFLTHILLIICTIQQSHSNHFQE